MKQIEVVKKHMEQIAAALEQGRGIQSHTEVHLFAVIITRLGDDTMRGDIAAGLALCEDSDSSRANADWHHKGMVESVSSFLGSLGNANTVQ